MLFSYGENIQQAGVQMDPLTPEDLIDLLRNNQQLREETARLRRVRAMDEAAYARLKVRLPYFSGSRFVNGIRRGAFFHEAWAIILDVDHLASSPEELQAWRERLAADPRVWLLFTSPGGDGLKLVLRLQEPCTDTKQFSDFYKAFAYDFAARHQLGDHLDPRTSDCTRVCFLVHDPQPIVNPQAQAIDWAAYLPLLTLFEDEEKMPPASIASREAAEADDEEESPDPPNESHNIRPDVYRDILRRLESRARPKPLGGRAPVVPGILAEVMPRIREALQAHSISIQDERDIQYGKKLACQSGADRAEVNIFFGKRGFSVVSVPRRQSHEDLEKLLVFLVEQALYQSPNDPEDGSLPSDNDLPW